MKVKRKHNNFFINIVPILSGIISSALVLGVLFPIIMGRNQVYKDIISEVSLTNSNKSGEFNIAFLSLIIGAIATLAVQKILKKYVHVEENDFKGEENELNLNNIADIYGIGLLITPIIVLWVFKQEINYYLLIISLIYFFSLSILKKKYIQPYIILLLLFTIYFSLLAFRSLLMCLFELIVINDKNIFIFSIIIFISIIVYSYKKENIKCINKFILIFQLPSPLILLTYFIDKYTYMNKIIEVQYSKLYYIFIISLIIILLTINIIQYLKKINNIENLGFSEVILLPTVIITFVLYFYSSPQQIHSADLWHLGELMLPWDQIINKGLIPYDEYSSASGLYPMLFGFFHNVILDGTVLSYAGAIALQNIFFAICAGVLCYYAIGGGISLFLAIMIPLPYYSRPLIFISLFLILILPQLIKNRIRWLQIYFLCSLMAGLYYPLNGVAFTLSGLPFAIIQLISAINEKDIKREIRKKQFHILNVICLISFLLIIKMLFRMAKYILCLSVQSKLADGITAYGLARVQSWFMPYLSHEGLRKNLYTIAIFLIPISVFLIFVHLLHLYLTKNTFSILEQAKSPGFLLLCVGVISLPINYTFTFIRIDNDAFLARSGYTIVIFAGIILTIFLWKYGKVLFDNLSRFILIGIGIGISLFVQGIGIGTEINRIPDSYNVTDDYVYVDGEKLGIPKLGKGFMVLETARRLESIKEVMDKVISEDETFLDMSFSQELYYIFDKKVPVPTPGTYVVSSGKASQPNIEAMKKNPPPLIIWEPAWYGSAIRNYYMYRWIIDQGYVLYRYNEYNFLIRPDKYEECFGDYKEVHRRMIDTSDITYFVNADIQGTANAWGKSIDSLMHIFIEDSKYKLSDLYVSANQMDVYDYDGVTCLTIAQADDPFFVLSFPKTISGSDADFIYLKLNCSDKNDMNERKAEIYWETTELPIDVKRRLTFNYGSGELLIPVGVHPGWSYSDITKIRIDLDGFQVGSKIKVEDIKLLKLNEEWMK